MSYSPGDNVWIINGMRNRAFAATVVSEDSFDGTVKVWNEDKETEQTFVNGVALGEYKVDPPILVEELHPLAQKLERQFQHRQLGEEIIEAAKEFRTHPEVNNLAAITALVEEWKSFIGIDLT